MRYFCMIIDVDGKFHAFDQDAPSVEQCRADLINHPRVKGIENIYVAPSRSEQETLLDLYHVKFDEIYETGPRLASVRKFHEAHWRTQTVLTRGDIPGRMVIYVAGTRNRLYDWRLVKYYQHVPYAPTTPTDRGWVWKCEEVCKGDADEVLRHLAMEFKDLYPRFSVAGEPLE